MVLSIAWPLHTWRTHWKFRSSRRHLEVAPSIVQALVRERAKAQDVCMYICLCHVCQLGFLEEIEEYQTGWGAVQRTCPQNSSVRNAWRGWSLTWWVASSLMMLLNLILQPTSTLTGYQKLIGSCVPNLLHHLIRTWFSYHPHDPWHCCKQSVHLYQR